jgi:hypothetical protein
MANCRAEQHSESECKCTLDVIFEHLKPGEIRILTDTIIKKKNSPNSGPLAAKFLNVVGPEVERRCSTR